MQRKVLTELQIMSQKAKELVEEVKTNDDLEIEAEEVALLEGLANMFSTDSKSVLQNLLRNTFKSDYINIWIKPNHEVIDICFNYEPNHLTLEVLV